MHANFVNANYQGSFHVEKSIFNNMHPGLTDKVLKIGEVSLFQEGYTTDVTVSYLGKI